MKELQQNVTVRGIIAVIILVGGGWLLAYENLNERNETLVGAMIMAVIWFYYGTSQGSEKKDQTIENMTTYKKGGNE